MCRLWEIQTNVGQYKFGCLHLHEVQWSSSFSRYKHKQSPVMQLRFVEQRRAHSYVQGWQQESEFLLRKSVGMQFQKAKLGQQ